MKNILSRLKYPLIIISIALVALLIAFNVPKINQGVSKITDNLVDKVTKSDEQGELKIHYFDVGQGDSEFIELPNGETILIDAGERDKGQIVVEKIKNLGYQKIDYVIATHPHSDHIGGMMDVYDAFEIKSTYMPNCTHTTNTYEEFITSVENEKCDTKVAFADVNMIDKDGILAYFVAPNSEEYDKINNYSACLMLKYGENSFLFMGDAEQESEYEIAGDITCDVIKIGHHGSDTSSSYNFVTRTSAKYGVISCGKNNDYGHPHDSTLSTWKENGTTIFRTDLNGDITFVSNGRSITYQSEYSHRDKDDVKRNPNVAYNGETTSSDVTTTTESYEQQIPNQTGTSDDTTSSTYSSKNEYKFVLNTYRKKIHYPNCEAVDQMSPQNRKYTNKTVKELKKEGYSPCKKCRPSD